MEAISTTVPSINVLNPKSQYFHRLKPPHFLHHPQIPTTAPVAGKLPTSISTKPTTSTHHKFTPHQLPSTSQPSPTPSPARTHRNAATGYAAALIDAALCNNSIDAIHKDVRRLLKWLQNNEMLKDTMADSSIEEGVKGRVIKEVSEKAKLRRQVVTMVKMLVAKNKSGMVEQVMLEFERIYHELTYSLRVVG